VVGRRTSEQEAIVAKSRKTPPATGESNTVKNPDEWKTKDEPMTGAQRSYLKTLSDEAKEPFEDDLTKSEASKRIDELQEKTGRGPERDAGGDRNGR
jgi:hypothetical protein